jgi:hypothetical protein
MKATGVTFEVRCTENFERDGELHAVKPALYLCRRVNELSVLKKGEWADNGYWQVLNDRGAWVKINGAEYSRHFSFHGRVRRQGVIRKNPLRLEEPTQ